MVMVVRALSRLISNYIFLLFFLSTVQHKPSFQTEGTSWKTGYHAKHFCTVSVITSRISVGHQTRPDRRCWKTCEWGWILHDSVIRLIPSRPSEAECRAMPSTDRLTAGGPSRCTSPISSLANLTLSVSLWKNLLVTLSNCRHTRHFRYESLLSI